MTPEQRAALEGVAGRTLTADELAAIEAPLAIRNDVALAALLSAGRTKLGPVNRADMAIWAASTGMRSKIQDFSAAVGHPLRDSALAILDVLVGAASDGIDLSRAANQIMLAEWVNSGALSAENRDALLALATTPDPVAVGTVSDALNVAEGRLTL